jgi:hypothetical protein
MEISNETSAISNVLCTMAANTFMSPMKVLTIATIKATKKNAIHI